MQLFKKKSVNGTGVWDENKWVDIKFGVAF